MNITEAEKLAWILMRCRTVLGNMALENEGALVWRWPISHEPLRADAKNLVPLIDEALSAYHQAVMAGFASPPPAETRKFSCPECGDFDSAHERMDFCPICRRHCYPAPPSPIGGEQP